MLLYICYPCLLLEAVSPTKGTFLVPFTFIVPLYMLIKSSRKQQCEFKRTALLLLRNNLNTSLKPFQDDSLKMQRMILVASCISRFNMSCFAAYSYANFVINRLGTHTQTEREEKERQGFGSFCPFNLPFRSMLAK